MKTITAILLLLLSSSTTQAVANPTLIPTITYPDRVTAMRALDLKLGTQLAEGLIRNLASKNATQSLSIISEFADQPELDIITLEYAYFKLAEHARIYQGTNLEPAVLNFLISYRSRAQIIHPESRNSSLPVFNIRAIAAGARNLQLRENALLTAKNLENQPTALLQHYLAVNPVGQAALRGAALTLTPPQQTQLLALGMQQLKSSTGTNNKPAGIVDLVSALAFEQSNLTALTSIIQRAPRQHLPNILKQISTALVAEDAKTLLYQAISGEPEIAAIAIHYLSKFSSTDNTIYADLLNWLSEPDLATAAALALSSSQHKQLNPDLQRLSSSTDATTARNAKLALDLLAESSLEGSL